MSVAWDVLTSVQTILQGLSLANVDPAEIRIRRRFERDGRDVAPGIIIVGELEEVEEETSSGLILLIYPVIVGLLTPRDNNPDWAQWEKTMRQTIRQALYVPALPGVASICNVDYLPQPAVNLESWGDSYEVLAQRFRYWSDELRQG
jgi:hypothetical protein